jgi:hypothetical protein
MTNDSGHQRGLGADFEDANRMFIEREIAFWTDGF